MVNLNLVGVDHDGRHVTVLGKQPATLSIMWLDIYYTETTDSSYLSPTTEQSRHLLVLKTTWTGGPKPANSEARVSLTSLSVFTLNVCRVEVSCINLLCSMVREVSDRNL